MNGDSFFDHFGESRLYRVLVVFVLALIIFILALKHYINHQNTLPGTGKAPPEIHVETPAPANQWETDVYKIAAKILYNYKPFKVNLL